MKRSKSLTALLDKVVNIPVLQVIILIIVFTLISMFSLSAQTPCKDSGADGATPVQIGDTIPESLWNAALESVDDIGEKKSVSLSDFKDKLILIDFWATWCGSCIKELPKLNMLQKRYEKDIKFLIVSEEPKLKIQTALKRLKIDTANLVFISADTVLKKAFPHRLIPHEVWIKNRKVRSTTAASELTEANISRLLSTDSIDVEIKKDLMEYNLGKSLSENARYFGIQPLYQYQSILLDQIKGAGGSGGNNSEDNNLRLSFLNLPLTELYKAALGVKVTDNNKIIWDADPSVDLKNSLFCYEIKSLSEIPLTKLKEIMLSDLNRHFHLEVFRRWKGNNEYFIVRTKPTF